MATQLTAVGCDGDTHVYFIRDNGNTTYLTLVDERYHKRVTAADSQDIAMSTTPDANGGDVDRPSNVLLLAPSVERDADAVCEELLHTTGTDRTHALLVTCLASPADRLAAWTGRGGDPARTTVIDVETASRSAAATAGTGESLGVPNATVEHVPDATDLIELGNVVERHLAAEGGEQTSLCLYSLSDLLQATDTRSVFKFVEVLTSAVERAGAVAHFHVNPDVHDPETVATIEVLFETVVDLRNDGVVGH